jgi:hypothetical protein
MFIAHDTYIENDENGRPVEKHVINTVGDFDLLVKRSVKGFQNIHNISGIAAINEPIKIRLQRATGVLSSEAKLYDPATKVQESIVQNCKDISEEFNPDMKLIPLDRVR